MRIRDSEVDMGTGPGKRAVRLAMRSERAFPRMAGFFLNRGRYCRLESPKLFCKEAKINSPLVEDK